MMIEESEQVHRLACQELRGGNHLAAFAAELPGLAGWVSCHPLDPSPRGGDLYYLSACSQGVAARVALADVAGHGELVSAAAGRLRDALRLHVDQWDQSTLIRRLGLTFEVRHGETLVVIGGSGSGKSTMLRALAGLEKPSSGAIRIKGVDITKAGEREMDAIRKRIGLAFQGGALIGPMTVGENIALPLLEHTTLQPSTIDVMVRIKLE